jgi:hypothetical protein
MGDKRCLHGNGIACPTWRRSRWVFSTVVLLGHVVVIYFMRESVNSPRAARRDEVSAMPIYIMPLAELGREKPRKVDTIGPIQVKRPRPRESTAIAIPEPPRESTATQVPAPQPAPDLRTTQPDWVGDAERSVTQLERSTSERRGFVKEDGPANEAPAGVVDRKSPHRAGAIEILGPGYERRWISSRCYREFGGSPSLLAGHGFKVTPISCLVGSGPPDSDLFEHLRPEYLRRKE